MGPTSLFSKLRAALLCHTVYSSWRLAVQDQGSIMVKSGPFSRSADLWLHPYKAEDVLSLFKCSIVTLFFYDVYEKPIADQITLLL